MSNYKALIDPDSWQISTAAKLQIIYAVTAGISLYFLFTLFSWLGLLASLTIYIFYSKIVGEIGYHRYYCHRSFKANPWFEWLVVLSSVPASFGGVLRWVATHRIHHEHSDHDGDPHSPRLCGALNVWFLHLSEMHVAPRYVKDIMRDKRHMFIHRHFFKLYILWVVIICALSYLIGWEWIAYLWAIPAATNFFSSALVNVVCHVSGYKTYETNDWSTNNIWVNFITLGCGMHNNHHGRPSDYDCAGQKWYEFDLWGWVIRHCLKK